jgi:hypothetical protein
VPIHLPAQLQMLAAPNLLDVANANRFKLAQGSF